MENGSMLIEGAASHAGKTLSSPPLAQRRENVGPSQATPVLTLAAHRAVFARIASGELTVDAIRHAFEHLVRDGDPVRDELTRTRTTQALEEMGGPLCRGLKKPVLVERAYESMLDAYGALTVKDGACLTMPGWTHEARIAALRDRLAALTPELLDGHRQRVQAEAARRQTLVEHFRKAITDPVTLDEFDVFVRHRGEAQLSAGQRLARDALLAASGTQQATGNAAEAAVVKVAPTRQGEAKSAKNPDGARRLRAIAEKLEATARANLSRDRLANTARRARMASSAQDAARTDLAMAGTMTNLAAALERGEAIHLRGLREKAQVEQLISLIQIARHKEAEASGLSYRERETMRDAPATLRSVEHVAYPAFRADAGDLRSVCSALQGVPGAARLVSQMNDLMERAAAMQGPLPVKAELVEACFDKLGDAAARAVPWYWLDVRARLKRLSRMGIDSPEQLRMACREFLQYSEARQQADRAVELERALIGSKVGFDFFPTPRALARRMVELASVQSGDRVLEPSAGNGNIAEAIRQAGVEPEVVEIASPLRDILQAKGFNLVGWDFVDVAHGDYSAIVMNPPFSNNADIAHVRHAYGLLRNGGRLVSIVGEGAFMRRGKTEAAFRQWLDEIDAEVEALPAGTFSDRQLMATTGANARLVVIRK